MNTFYPNYRTLFKFMYFVLIALCPLEILSQCSPDNLGQNVGYYVVGHDRAGQSFTATCTGYITSITVVYNNIPITSTDRILNVRDGGTATSPLLHTQVIPFNSIVQGANYFVLTTPIYINAFEVNSFEITEPVQVSTSASGVAHNDNGQYADGIAWFGGGGAYPDYDLTFEVNIGEQCIPDNLTPDQAELPSINAQCSVETIEAPTATNSCGTIVTGVSDVSFPLIDQGMHLITWTFNDGSGNTTTQNQLVQIFDTEPPTPPKGLPDLVAECSLEELIIPYALDACNGDIPGVSDITLPFSTQGSTVITWTFTDSEGNSSTQTQNVLVSDNEAPVPVLATLPDLVSCSEIVPTPPLAEDGCQGMVTATTNILFPITTPGTITIIWLYTDDAGNESVQFQNAVINDVNTDVVQSGNMLAAVESGAQYQWLDCENKLSPIAGEDNQSFTLESGSGSFAVQITQNGCTEISDCFELDVIDYIPELTATGKKLIGIYDVTGRACEFRPGELLMYRYSDGSVERKVANRD